MSLSPLAFAGTSSKGSPMPESVWRLLFAQRFRGRPALVIGGIRALVGALFAFGFSLSKFTDHAHEVTDFKRFGVPLPGISIYVAGSIELVGGLLLVVGLLTRLGALMLALDMVGAVLTAGRNVGGAFHLGVAPLMFFILVVLLVTGPGAVAIDTSLGRRLFLSAK